MQSSDFSNSLPKSENLREFKPPASRSRTYCDCNPNRAYETFDVSKERVSKTSKFWMFWNKRDCNWLAAIKEMALWSRGFSRGSLFKTWPKPETKSLWHPGTQGALNGKFNYALLFLRNYIYKSKLSEETLLLPKFVDRFNLRYCIECR